MRRGQGEEQPRLDRVPGGGAPDTRGPVHLCSLRSVFFEDRLVLEFSTPGTPAAFSLAHFGSPCFVEYNFLTTGPTTD